MDCGSYRSLSMQTKQLIRTSDGVRGVGAGRCKLQHSPSLVALGLSMRHETCMASNWLFYWPCDWQICVYTVQLLTFYALWAVLSFPPEFLPVFRCHWQSPCTTPGNSCDSEWYAGGLWKSLWPPDAGRSSLSRNVEKFRALKTLLKLGMIRCSSYIFR